MKKNKLNNRWKNWRDFLLVMTWKELKSKYKMTTFGFLWAFLTPVVQVLVLNYIFKFFTFEKIPNYFIFIFSGLLLWNFVTSTILRSVTVIVDERYLIQKSSFPKEILVLAIAATNLVHMLISLGILMLIMLVLGLGRWEWIFLPLAIIPLIFLTSGLSLLLSALNVRHRDVNFMTQIVTMLWFYATPIVYSLDIFPNQEVFWFGLNPLVGIIDITRWIFMGIKSNYLGLDIISMSLSFLIFLIGFMVFKKRSPFFSEYV